MEPVRAQFLGPYEAAPAMSTSFCAQTSPETYGSIVRKHTRDMLAELIHSIDADPFPLLRCVKKREIEDNGYLYTLYAEIMSVLHLGPDVDSDRRAKLLKIKADLVRAYNYSNSNNEDDDVLLEPVPNSPGLVRLQEHRVQNITPAPLALPASNNGRPISFSQSPAKVSREHTNLVGLDAVSSSRRILATPRRTASNAPPLTRSAVRQRAETRAASKHDAQRVPTVRCMRTSASAGIVLKRSHHTFNSEPLSGGAPHGSPLHDAVASAIASVRGSVNDSIGRVRGPLSSFGITSLAPTTVAASIFAADGRTVESKRTTRARHVPVIRVVPPTPPGIATAERESHFSGPGLMPRPPIRTRSGASPPVRGLVSPHKSSFSDRTYFV